VLLLAIGTQTVFASFFISILSIDVDANPTSEALT
jgi:hypothetical protein